MIGSAAFAHATVTDVVDDGRLGQVEIMYRFRAGDGRDYPGRVRVDRDRALYARTKPLETIPVQFIKAHPWENALIENTPGESFAFMLFVPIFFLTGFLGPVLVARLLRIFRDRRLFRRGKLARGTVIFIKPGAIFVWWGWSGATTAEVFVRFPDDSGSKLEARALCQNDWLIRQLAPGTPVHIVYLPKRPSRAVLLEAYVR